MPKEQNVDASVTLPNKQREPRLPEKENSAKRVGKRPKLKQAIEPQPTANISW
jgi:hypothetical protein